VFSHSCAEHSTAWLKGKSGHHQSYYQQAMGSAVRSHDPYQEIRGAWLIRRLSPDSNPIGIDDLPKERDEEPLLRTMGSEVANVHLGTSRQVTNILKDLRRRDPNWLRVGAKKMGRVVEEEWQHYRES
jgi:hypothetical protein